MLISKRHSAGMTLVEVLVYISVAAVLVVLCGKLFASNLRLQSLSTQTLDRMNTVSDIQREFTRAVRGASGVVPAVGAHVTGENRLVLQAEPVEGRPHYIVFGMLRDKQHFSRMDVVEKDGQFEASRFVTSALPLQAVQFNVAADGLIHLTITLTKDVVEDGVEGISCHFDAVPRGIGVPL